MRESNGYQDHNTGSLFTYKLTGLTAFSGTWTLSVENVVTPEVIFRGDILSDASRLLEPMEEGEKSNAHMDKN